jgi:serine/threonine-protein phosphatase 2A regulatory subunit B'
VRVLGLLEQIFNFISIAIFSCFRLWPQTNSPKTLLFLNETEEVLEFIQPAEFLEILVPLFTRINRCLSSTHFHTAERTLYYWNNDMIVSMMTQYRRQILPILIPGIMENSKKHWHRTVQEMTFNAYKFFNDMDPKLFDEVLRNYKKSVEQ